MGNRPDVSIVELAQQWLRLDKDPATRAEMQDLLARNDTSELQRRLEPRIAFGTAGLRARMEAGFARINCLTVIQTSQGLAEHLLRKRSSSGARLKAVVGYDGRRHSKRFAQLAAAAFLAKGFEVVWFRDVVHTPLVPFAVKTRGLDAGVMITASHNPKEDNGYKVYAATGCQINHPEDQAIAQAIMENLEPIIWDISQVELQKDWLDEITNDYTKSLAQKILIDSAMPEVVYTPMHGVGLSFFLNALHQILAHSAGDPTNLSVGILKTLESGFRAVYEQSHPDPEFPTVKYPNPEEQGALDLAKAEADRHDVRIVLANDPDADRFAAAQKLDDGTWYQFNGDEMGALLGYHVYGKYKTYEHLSEPLLMITSAVSSQMLAAIGKQDGFEVQETLTGFKWIGDEALRAGTRAVFGYEEALGYMLPSDIYDKDGVSAACLFLEACCKWNKMPYDVLQDLYKKYGYFKTTNTYWKSPTLELTKETFKQIQTNPRSIFNSLWSSTRCRIRDAMVGTDTGMEDGRSSFPILPDNLMVTLWLSKSPELQEGVRITIRASGTEPKIKVYVECQSCIGSSEARSGAILALKAVRKTWFNDPRLQMEGKYESETR